MVRFMTLVAVALTCTAVAATVALKPYPGAKIDEKASQTATTMLKSLGEKKASMLKATVYMTGDGYEKVTAYYLAKGKETHPPSTKPDEHEEAPVRGADQRDVHHLRRNKRHHRVECVGAHPAAVRGEHGDGWWEGEDGRYSRCHRHHGGDGEIAVAAKEARMTKGCPLHCWDSPCVSGGLDTSRLMV